MLLFLIAQLAELLQIDEALVETVLLQELFVVAGLDDTAGVEDKDPVRLLDGRESMCDGDDDDLAFASQAFNELLHDLLRSRVETRRRLVEDEHFGARKERDVCARDADPLFLSAGEPYAALADLCVKAVFTVGRHTDLPLVADFDLVHVHNTDFFLDALALTRWAHRRPVIVSTHGGFFHTDDYAKIKQVYFTLVTRRALRTAAAVIPNSAGDERRFAPHARREARIDNALDFDAFARIQHDPAPGRLITVGRLSANKNVSALLKVFAEARAIRSDLTLVVVGDGPLRAELRSQAAELKIAEAVRWTGEVSDEQLHAELAAAEIFVSASRYEGFGLALLEAMAVGVIPVVNKIEAFRGVIADGQDGFLANYMRPDVASQTLVRVAGLPAEWRAQLSAQAKIRASQFDWADALPKFEEVYRTVLTV